MMKRGHKINSILMLLAFCSALCCHNKADAQVAKELNKTDNRGYSIMENDMRCYQILCESSMDKKEYAEYYKIIREKIKDKLMKNYKYGFKKGEVSIIFILNFDGSLVKLEVNGDSSIKNGELTDIAALSVKQASPFPPFPGTLPRSPASFNVKISFRDS